ncbi:MAG: hypothetical protein JWO11_3706 [Nocardioides sp.]|nr:hypothetical protein [Nocardioides sp.]
MTSSTTSTTDKPATGRRSDAFAQAVSEQKLKTDGASRDGLARVAGLVLMVVGVVGSFAAWQNSTALSDSRDIASSQIMAVAFVGLTVLGAGLYVAGAIARVLRLWLLRQLVESQDRMDQLAEVLRENKPRH